MISTPRICGKKEDRNMRNMNRSDGRPMNKHTRSIRRIRSKEKIDIVFTSH